MAKVKSHSRSNKGKGNSRVKSHSRKKKSAYGSASALHKKISGMPQFPNDGKRTLKGYKSSVETAGRNYKKNGYSIGKGDKKASRRSKLIYTKKGSKHR